MATPSTGVGRGVGGGRPTKFDNKMYRQVTELALLGYSNEKIAAFLGVTGCTISTWAKENPKFSKAIADGRENADMKVARSLHQRAVGYDVTEKQVVKNAQGDIKSTKTIKKHIPGDVTAQMKWLSNKAGWKDRTEIGIDGNTVVHTVDVTLQEAKEIRESFDKEF